MTDLLSLWLRGLHLGDLQRLRNGRLRLRYSTEAVDRWGEGAAPLSLSLPLTSRRVEGPVLDRFLDNLLPESGVRAQLARLHGVSPADTFGLLAAVGQECAGAVQFVAGDAAPSGGHLRPLDDVEVSRLVSDLPTLAPPDGLAVSASLGGVQAKLLLTRTTDGWAWPAEGAMSTHLVKPEPIADRTVPGLVRYEEWALRLARTAGIPAAHAELAEFDGREAIVVERFDRHAGARVHQEDFAQALGLGAADKYEASGRAPGLLAEVAKLAGAESIAPDALRSDLLRLVTFNAVIGNGDAHAKNYSLTIDGEALYSLAPLYDAAPVYLVSPVYRHSGLAVAGRNRLDLITGAHLVDEAATWGLPRDAARDVVATTTAAVRAALDDVPSDALPKDVAPQVAERADAMAHAVG